MIPPLSRIGERWNASVGLLMAALLILRGREARVLFTHSTNLDPSHPAARALLSKK